MAGFARAVDCVDLRRLFGEGLNSLAAEKGVCSDFLTYGLGGPLDTLGYPAAAYDHSAPARGGRIAPPARHGLKEKGLQAT